MALNEYGEVGRCRCHKANVHAQLQSVGQEAKAGIGSSGKGAAKRKSAAKAGAKRRVRGPKEQQQQQDQEQQDGRDDRWAVCFGGSMSVSISYSERPPGQLLV